MTMTMQVGLHELKKGEKMVIHSIIENQHFGEMDSLVTRRLADLGFSSGMPITIISTGLFKKGPFAVRIGSNAQFSLRMAEAMKIIGHR